MSVQLIKPCLAGQRYFVGGYRKPPCGGACLECTAHRRERLMGKVIQFRRSSARAFHRPATGRLLELPPAKLAR